MLRTHEAGTLRAAHTGQTWRVAFGGFARRLERRGGRGRGRRGRQRRCRPEAGEGVHQDRSGGIDPDQARVTHERELSGRSLDEIKYAVSAALAAGCLPGDTRPVPERDCSSSRV